MSAHRLTLGMLVSSCALAGALVFGSAVASAAASPTIVEESFSNVALASATVSAQVNANGFLTSYRFEYGTSVAYGSTTPVASLGAGSGAVGVATQLSGLQPDTAYHFRVIATNESGAVQGGDVTFNTFPPASSALPDGRGYEMVSPVIGQNANVYPPATGRGEAIETKLPFRASVDGSAVAYVAEPPASGGNGSIGEGKGNEYLATRGVSGWTALDIMPAGSAGPNYQAFSSDLSVGILDSYQPLSAGVPTETDVLYSRTSGDRAYHPFFATKPNRYVYAFEVDNNVFSSLLAYAGASSDLDHLLFEANGVLTSDAVDGGETHNNLYDSVGGRPRVVNVLPNGTADPNATFGFKVGANPNFTHVISADGSRIFWTDLNTGDLYVRENDATSTPTTVQVDAGVGGGGRFWTASADGSKVFFTKGDLYEYDLESGQTTDLTPAGGVQGVLGTSEDGSYVYFVANGALASGATPQTCEPGNSSAGCNLYVFHQGEPLKFIGTLSASDGNESLPFWNHTIIPAYGDWASELGYRTAQATPDGHSLVFTSVRSLTGYPSAGMTEVYVYDAVAGNVRCVSCDPSGESPPLVSEVAAWLPISWSHTYQPRVISNDGSRVFFDSVEPLVPRDTNGSPDVYEWERDGAGSCHRASGCIYLLSGGTNADASYLGDASASGNDVFIVARAQLLPQDGNENYDLYDVRVGVSPPLAAPACSGTGCQGVPPAPPIFATPSSVTFEGVGNFPPQSNTAVAPKPKCKRSFAKGSGKCVKKRSKRIGKRSKKKPTKTSKRSMRGRK